MAAESKYRVAKRALERSGAGALDAAFADAGDGGQGGGGGNALDEASLLRLLGAMRKKATVEDVCSILGPLSSGGSLATTTVNGAASSFGAGSQVRQALTKLAALYNNKAAQVLAALDDGSLQARVDAEAKTTGAGGHAGAARQAAARLVATLLAISAALGVALLVDAGGGVGKVALLAYRHSDAGADAAYKDPGQARALATANVDFLRRVEAAAFADGGAGTGMRAALLRNVFARGELEPLEPRQLTILSVVKDESASDCSQVTAANVAGLRQACMRYGGKSGESKSSADGGEYGNINSEDDADCKGRLWDLVLEGAGMASGDWAIVLRFKQQHALDDQAFSRAFWAELGRLGFRGV
jgi:hypothetical protein